jgi:exodeoxyribonuclease VII large subunit
MNRLNRSKPVTVSELTARIKQVLEQGFSRVEVLGEVSRLSRHASGHVYFTIKDPEATLSAILWRSTYLRLSIRPEESQQYIFSGYISLYEPRGIYQLIVTGLKPAGEGALAAEFERRKRLFAKRGWFDPARKIPIPAYPHRIGIVTSPNAAALEDVRKVLATRPAWLELLLSPCLVQGGQAAEDIARSIARLISLPKSQRPDVLLLVRGGGSIEDLWCFNEESVVKAIVDCDIPVITGIGHEVDITLAELAADVRAATPSNAAELACPDRETLRRRLPRLGLLNQLVRNTLSIANRRYLAQKEKLIHTWQLSQSRRHMQLERMRSRGSTLLHQACRQQRQLLNRLVRRLSEQQPRSQMVKRQRLLAACQQHLHDAAFRYLDRQQGRIMELKATLHALSPYRVLSRGYTLTMDERGRVIGSARQLLVDERVGLRFHDGNAGARIESLAISDAGQTE